MNDWTYRSKLFVLSLAIKDLEDFACWGKTSNDLKILESIKEDLHRLEGLEK